MSLKYEFKTAKLFKKQIKKLSQEDRDKVYFVIEKLANGEVLDKKITA
ncbi:hypothetical protein [Helicobacter sp. 11S02596-1]